MTSDSSPPNRTRYLSEASYAIAAPSRELGAPPAVTLVQYGVPEAPACRLGLAEAQTELKLLPASRDEHRVRCTGTTARVIDTDPRDKASGERIKMAASVVIEASQPIRLE